MKTIYLCGPINNCSDADCRDWRNTVKSSLAGRFRFLDPMRRDYRGRENGFVKELVEADYEDIRAADIILVWAEQPSWGTAMEVHQAFAVDRKFVVAICPDARVSPWLRYHTHQLMPSLNSAVEWLLKLAEADQDPEIDAPLSARNTPI